MLCEYEDIKEKEYAEEGAYPSLAELGVSVGATPNARKLSSKKLVTKLIYPCAYEIVLFVSYYVDEA